MGLCPCPQPLSMGRRCLVGCYRQREERCESSLWLSLVQSESQRETGFVWGCGNHGSLTAQQKARTTITGKSPHPRVLQAPCQALCNVHLLAAKRDKRNLPHAEVLGVSAWAWFLAMLSMQMSSSAALSSEN